MELTKAAADVLAERKRPSPSQIKEFIRYAELEAGPVCCDDWFRSIVAVLEAVAAQNKETPNDAN